MKDCFWQDCQYCNKMWSLWKTTPVKFGGRAPHCQSFIIVQQNQDSETGKEGCWEVQYLRMPGGELLGQWDGPQWMVHFGHRSHSHKEPQTPSLQMLLDPWLPQCQGILSQRKGEKLKSQFTKAFLWILWIEVTIHDEGADHSGDK